LKHTGTKLSLTLHYLISLIGALYLELPIFND